LLGFGSDGKEGATALPKFIKEIKSRKPDVLLVVVSNDNLNKSHDIKLLDKAISDVNNEMKRTWSAPLPIVFVFSQFDRLIQKRSTESWEEYCLHLSNEKERHCTLAWERLSKLGAFKRDPPTIDGHYCDR